MAGNAIGFGTARVAALLNPERIVIVGPGTRAFDLIEPSMVKAIEDGVTCELRQNLRVEAIPTDLDLIVRGTIDAALRHLDSEIFAFGPTNGLTINKDIQK
jgi:predicted NBD/HSP70 family sugar kinase